MKISTCFGVTKKSWAIGNFSPGNRFSHLTIPNWSYNHFLGPGSFLWNSVVRAARFSRLKARVTINNLFTWKIKFPCHPYYSSRQKGFPSHFRLFGCMPGPVSAKYSAQRNILEAFPIPLDRFWSQEGSDKFSANSVVWAARFSQLKGAKRTNNQLPSKSEFALHPYYSSSRKMLSESFRKPKMNFVHSEALPATPRAS